MTNNFATKARALAFYLPQFYPIPENDEWWEPGFTEWTNVAKALPLFDGHHQPDLPADLGFYDLRVPETRERQAELARSNGVEGFIYWHYWFGNGRRILERVCAEVLESGKPDFPFCVAWANQTWSGIWHGLTNKILIEQQYPGEEDLRRHFELLLKMFRDPRYIRVNGKPLLIVFRGDELPDTHNSLLLFRSLAAEAGLPGLHIVGILEPGISPSQLGYDAACDPEPGVFCRLNHSTSNERGSHDSRLQARIRRKLVRVTERLTSRMWKAKTSPLPRLVSYEACARSYVAAPKCSSDRIPCVIPNWDNTPRSSHRGLVLTGSSPDLYQSVLEKAVADVADRPAEERLVFIKSWNEWAEGNYLEPSRRFGHQYLKATANAVFSK